MKIVIDTNVIMAALLKDSIVRKILNSENIQFFIPEHALKEISKYKSELCQKSNLSEDEFGLVINLLMDNIEIVPEVLIKEKINEAEQIMGNIDIKDAPFIATALSIDCDGIWSFDEDFKKQHEIKVWEIKELIKLI